MKAGWEREHLGALCKFVRGPFGGSLKKSMFVGEGYAVYEQQHAINNQFEYVRYFVNEEKFNEMKRFELNSGDLIMSCSGTMGKVAKVPVGIARGIINQALLKLTISAELNSDYLLFWMNSPDFQQQLSAETTGVAIKNVASVKVLKEISIPLPPLAEQKQIVSVLDQAFAGIEQAAEAARKNRDNARELFETTLNATFTQKGEGWVETTLGEVCERFEYGTSEKSGVTGSVAVLRMGNIQSRVLDWAKLVYTDNELEIEKYALKDGDVLFNRTNSPELVGKTAIYRNEQPAIFAGYLIRVHPLKDAITPEFLNYFLNSSSARDYGKTVMSGSVNQANISGSKLKLYPIILPKCMIEQAAITENLDRLSEETQRLEALYQQKLDALEELKQSLLQKAFAGELTSELTADFVADKAEDALAT
ncbi:MAG: restriction endonuclease subunit S [Cognatishimia sp.]